MNFSLPFAQVPFQFVNSGLQSGNFIRLQLQILNLFQAGGQQLSGRLQFQDKAPSENEEKKYVNLTNFFPRVTPKY